MVHLPTLVEYLQETLDVFAFKDYCTNGLQIEGDHQEITRLATAVSANLETIEAAIEQKAQALLVHHGLFWNSQEICIGGIVKQKVKQLLDHGISLLAYHLPLDAHKDFGNNYRAAKEMSWKNIQGFGPKYSEYSLGVIGEVEPVHAQKLQKTLEDYYCHPATAALFGPQTISKVALISGGAHKEIERAAQEGADAFITGSFDEPTWHLAKEHHIHFFAMGHANTEIIGPKALGNHLQKHFKLTHHFLDIPNPF